MVFFFFLVNEGKVLLDALANRRKVYVQHVILNGQNIMLSSLEKRLTYVRHDAQLSPDLNVAQTLTFHSHLRQPPKTAVGKTSVSDQVRINIFYNISSFDQFLIPINFSKKTPSKTLLIYP